MPAGATPALLRPMRTQNLPPGITCPSAGQMMYTFALSGMGFGSATARPQVAAKVAAAHASRRLCFIVPPSCCPAAIQYLRFLAFDPLRVSRHLESMKVYVIANVRRTL